MVDNGWKPVEVEPEAVTINGIETDDAIAIVPTTTT